jgi:hypothetical protein
MTAEQMKYEFDVGYDRITNFDAPGYVPKEISTFLTRAQEDIVYELLDSSSNEEMNKKAISKLRQVIPLSSFSTGNYPNGYITSLRVQLTDQVTFVADGITHSGNGFVTAGFRLGDVISVTGASTNNNKLYSVIGVTANKLTVSPQTLPGNLGTEAGVTIVADPILKLRNERADIEFQSGNFYYNRIPVSPPTVPVTYNNAKLDIEVDPIDDDFYSANKSNPYKKPSIKKIWRIDGADDSEKQHEYITDGTFTITTVHLHIDRRPRPIIVPETASIPYALSDDTIDGIYFLDFPAGLDCLLDSTVHRDIVDKAVKLAYAALQDQTGFQISSVQEQQNNSLT